MAYEGLANALAQIGSDYGRFGEENRRHERARSDRAADLAEQRANDKNVRKEAEDTANRMADRQTERSFEAALKKINELDPVAARAGLNIAARAAGIDNPESLSDSELHARMEKKSLETGSARIMAQALATYEAEQKVKSIDQNDPDREAKANKAQENLEKDNAKAITTARGEISSATAELNTMLKNVGVVGEMQDLPTLAARKVQEFLNNPNTTPAEIIAAAEAASLTSLTPVAWKKDQHPTLPQAQAYLAANAVKWAEGQGITDKTVLANNRAFEATLKQSGYAEQPAIAGLVREIAENRAKLRTLNVSSRSGALAPASDASVAPAAAPTGAISHSMDAPGAVAPAVAGPVGAPAAPVVPITPGASVPPPVAAPAAPSWWSENRDGAANQAAVLGAVKAAPAAVGNFFSGVAGRLNPGNYVPGSSVGSPARFAYSPQTAAPAPAPVPVSSPVMPAIDERVQKAREWLASTGVVLDPAVQNTLEQTFRQIVSSGLSPQEQSARMQELQKAAFAQDKRPRIDAAGSTGYWGAR